MKLLAYFKTELTLSFPCKMRSTLFSFSLSLNWSCGNSAFIKQNTLNFIFIKFAKFSNALMIPVYHISLTKILNFPNHCQRKGKKKWKRRRKKGKYKVCLCVSILPFLAPFSGLPGILQAPALVGVLQLVLLWGATAWLSGVQSLLMLSCLISWDSVP